MVGRGVLVGHVRRTPGDTEASGDTALGVSGTYAAGKVGGLFKRTEHRRRIGPWTEL